MVDEKWYPAGKVIEVCSGCGREKEYIGCQHDFHKLKEGFRNDEGKERVDLIPPEVILGLGKALEVGANKYAERNWEKGMDWSRVFGSLTRHLWKFWLGEDLDDGPGGTGLPHVYLILCNSAFLFTYYVRKIGTDNRNKVTKK